MADDNITNKMIENVVENISNIFKKTIIFEKTERMTGIFIGLIISTCIFGGFTIYNSCQVTDIANKITDIKEITDIVEKNEQFPTLYYNVLLENNNIFYKISISQVNTEKIIVNLNEKIDKVIALLEDKKEDSENK
jgi:hypothetical protein